MNHIFTFLKVSKREYLEEFRSGFLYMRPLSYFSKLNSCVDDQRADRNEGISALFQADQALLSLTGNRKGIIPKISNQIRVGYQSLQEQKYVFCLYALHDGYEFQKKRESKEAFLNSIKIPEEFRTLGESVLYIKAPKKFEGKVKEAIQSNHLNGRMAPVEYYDEESFNGQFPSEKIGFMKSTQFMRQNEYRILINKSDADGNPFKLYVGDISNISNIISIDEFNKMILEEFR